MRNKRKSEVLFTTACNVLRIVLCKGSNQENEWYLLFRGYSSYLEDLVGGTESYVLVLCCGEMELWENRL